MAPVAGLAACDGVDAENVGDDVMIGVEEKSDPRGDAGFVSGDGRVLLDLCGGDDENGGRHEGAAHDAEDTRPHHFVRIDESRAARSDQYKVKKGNKYHQEITIRI